MAYHDAPDRKSGELDAIVWEVDYQETVDLTSVPVQFDCWRELAGARVPKFVANASPEDVTPEGRPEKSVWRLVFTPNEAQVTVEYSETMIGEFVLDHGPGTGKKYQPAGQDFIRFAVYAHGSQV